LGQASTPLPLRLYNGSITVVEVRDRPPALFYWDKLAWTG
jgi:hypothetical protein